MHSWFKINCIEVWDTFARDWMELCEFISRWRDLAFRIQCTLLRKETWEAYTWMTAFLTLNTPLDYDLVRFFPYGTRSVPDCNRYKVSVKWKQVVSFLLRKHFSAFFERWLCKPFILAKYVYRWYKTTKNILKATSYILSIMLSNDYTWIESLLLFMLFHEFVDYITPVEN